MPAAQALTQKPSSTAPAQPLQAPSNTTDHKENSLVRLHLSPFNPALLKVYLAPSVLPLAQNISYHTLETFPEKGFGYVELPAMEAAKLKKKLNGSILKGSKVRIEDAKPEKRKIVEPIDEEEEERAKKRVKKDKKKKMGVLEGVELPDGRKVKRGWTEPATKGKKERSEKKDKDKRDKKEKKKGEKAEQKKSKFTKEPELLFKTKLTPVAANALEVSSKDKKKEKKKDKKSKREVIVHEFEKTTKHASFLKTAKVETGKKPAVEYVNGKGWVDEDGNVVEAETGKARNRRVLELVDRDTTTKEDKAAKDAEMTDAPPVEEVSGTLGAQSTPKSKSKETKKPKAKKAVTPPSSSSEESSVDEESSVVSSDSSSDEESGSESGSDAESDTLSAAQSSVAASIAAGSIPETTIIPSFPTEAPVTEAAPEEKKEIHPLEALYKRPAPTTSATSSTPTRLAPLKTSFSFFGDSNDNVDTMDMDTADQQNPSIVPMTPFTEKDLEWRGTRSAAPTPDTAAIGRRFSFPWREEGADGDGAETEGDAEKEKELKDNTRANAGTAAADKDDDSDSDGDSDSDSESDSDSDAESTPAGKGKADKAGSGKESKEEPKEEESEFGKWFWENRGDNNRAWKKRRRDGLKLVRLRENRKGGLGKF
ncbi:hypothetical protein GQ43DRAFT_442918 [Delitschia confertaspora ATCC 74209]|uniref:RRM domain-containing protein n=1 Tax=Delitschia confertaspora ATCC 74209 TaxID=1513339 RepID=A0A9P4JH06_9PLEO|nr:hypothetical protein GQ43DRAFT_442918 [Delitschia confertaspora ATCC 74209]